MFQPSASSSLSRLSSASPPLPTELLGLAPLRLPNRRATRYLGDGQFVHLAAMATVDQEGMRQTYADLGELLLLLVVKQTDDAGKRLEVQRWVGWGHVDALVRRMQEIGEATRSAGSMTEEIMRAIHDVRGGALSSLVGRLEMLDAWPGALSEKLNMLFVLTRDHMKIMRNALIGLDDVQRDRDRIPKGHAASLLTEKWHEAVIGPSAAQPAARMRMDCRYEGPVTECCLESAAIDRIFYNLANNASRHTADGDIEAVIFEVPASPGDCLRFVLSNAVSGDQAKKLLQLAAQPERSAVEASANVEPSAGAVRLDALFTPEVSTTGSGFGLAVVAEFTANAFGLKVAGEAARGGYVGAVLEHGRTFRAWFHWPIARRGLTPKLDDYRRPEQSLADG